MYILDSKNNDSIAVCECSWLHRKYNEHLLKSNYIFPVPILLSKISINCLYRVFQKVHSIGVQNVFYV